MVAHMKRMRYTGVVSGPSAPLWGDLRPYTFPSHCFTPWRLLIILR
jgi:hypothetical protein